MLDKVYKLLINKNLMEKLATTTFKNRHLERLEKVRKEAIKLNLYERDVIEIGPGGLVDFLADTVLHKSGEKMTHIDSFYRGITKLTETVLRHTGIFNLKTFEPSEILNALRELKPKKLYVLDIEQKVIDAAKRTIENDALRIPVEYCIIDVENQIPYKGDIVIAYTVAVRTRSPKRALQNIANCVNDGGLLSVTSDEKLNGFKQLDSGLYIKE